MIKKFTILFLIYLLLMNLYFYFSEIKIIFFIFKIDSYLFLISQNFSFILIRIIFPINIIYDFFVENKKKFLFQYIYLSILNNLKIDDK